MDKKFKAGDEVTCTWGSNKGEKFKVELILKDGSYSCSSVDRDDNKYYQYQERHLV